MLHREFVRGHSELKKDKLPVREKLKIPPLLTSQFSVAVHARGLREIQETARHYKDHQKRFRGIIRPSIDSHQYTLASKCESCSNSL